MAASMASRVRDFANSSLIVRARFQNERFGEGSILPRCTETKSPRGSRIDNTVRTSIAMLYRIGAVRHASL